MSANTLNERDLVLCVGTLGNPMTDARVSPVTMTAVRPLEIEGTHASPIPEPSAGFAIALLGSAFLIRRRRPRLD